MERREQALSQTTELFRECLLEPSVEDLLVVAEWLLTGSARLALEFSEQRAKFYGPAAGVSPDAATWSPGMG